MTRDAPVGARQSRASAVAVWCAVACSAALLVGGLLVPAYSGTTSTGEVPSGSATLVAVNGAGILPVLAIPLVASLVVGVALRRPGRRGALPVAWGATGLLAAFNALAMLSIGVVVLPVTVALVVACSTCRRAPTPR